MTIVARLTINDYPMVIGDLLLSIKDPLALPPSLPTAENLSSLFPAGSACVPYELRQKVAVVADNLVVGWSGVFNTAKDVIAELKRKSQSQPFTYDALTKHFEGLSQSVWDEIGLVGVLEESKERVFHWRRARKFWEAETTHFGKVTLLGSGQDDIGKTLVDVQQLPVGLERNLREWEQALGCCLQMTGYWLQLEIATLQSLKKLYGGGYEIATFIDDKYRKVDEITYMFWHARIDGDGIRFAFAPHKTFRYAYENDLLVIRSVSFDDNKDVPTVADQKLFCVEPVYRDADPCEKAAISPPTLNSRHLCVYFLLSTRKGIAVLAAVRRKSNVTDREWVTFTETQAGSVTIDVDRDFLQEMARQIFADPRIKR